MQNAQTDQLFCSLTFVRALIDIKAIKMSGLISWADLQLQTIRSVKHAPSHTYTVA